MKILWIVNIIFPYPAQQLKIEKTSFGGWLNGLAENLRNEEKVQLAIATTYNGEVIKKFNDGEITYYLLPGGPALKYKKELDKYCKEILDEYKPDIIHIHGTEFAHSISFLNTCDKDTKKVLSIQGLTSCIGRVYLSGISNKDILRNITFRDILKKDNLFQQKNNFLKRGIYEKEIINKCDYIIGRTDWDNYNSKAINENIKYYSLPETLREEFYKNEWNLNNIEKYSIYVSQGSYSIKGLHILLESIKIVKRQYPDVKLYISGDNIIKSDSFKDRIRLSGYAKYIKSLIKKYNLKGNVIFTGILNKEEVVNRLLKTHIVIVPSVIENESNSLTEAHLLAIPTIAAFSGGMTDRIIHKETGFFYPFLEAAMCAGYIIEYFNNDEIAIKYGKSAKEKALIRNNPEENKRKIIKIYSNIMGNEND